MVMLRRDPVDPEATEEQRRRRTLCFVLLLFSLPLVTLVVAVLAELAR